MRTVVVLMIRFYQRFLRGVVGRTCIYKECCSQYSIRLIERSDVPLIQSIQSARLRVLGCGVSEMTIARDAAMTEVRNRHGELLELTKLAPHVMATVDERQRKLLNRTEVPLFLDIQHQ